MYDSYDVMVATLYRNPPFFGKEKKTSDLEDLWGYG